MSSRLVDSRVVSSCHVESPSIVVVSSDVVVVLLLLKERSFVPLQQAEKEILELNKQNVVGVVVVVDCSLRFASAIVDCCCFRFCDWCCCPLFSVDHSITGIILFVAQSHAVVSFGLFAV